MPSRRPSRCVVVAVLTVAVAGAAACSSSNPASPKSPSTAALAAYYDNLATALTDSGGNDTLNAQFIAVFNGVIADGFAPSRVSVSLNGATALWYTNAATFVDSAATDSMQFVSLWSDTLATTVVIAQYEDNFLINLFAVTRGGDVATVVADAADSGSSIFGLIDRNCAITSITNVFPQIPTFADTTQVTCQAGSGHYDFAVNFPSGDPTPTGALQSLSADVTTTLAVRLQSLQESTSIPYARIPRAHLLSRRH
jgi:hypothetical protein